MLVSSYPHVSAVPNSIQHRPWTRPLVTVFVSARAILRGAVLAQQHHSMAITTVALSATARSTASACLSSTISVPVKRTSESDVTVKSQLAVFKYNFNTRLPIPSRVLTPTRDSEKKVFSTLFPLSHSTLVSIAG